MKKGLLVCSVLALSSMVSIGCQQGPKEATEQEAKDSMDASMKTMEKDAAITAEGGAAPAPGTGAATPAAGGATTAPADGGAKTAPADGGAATPKP